MTKQNENGEILFDNIAITALRDEKIISGVSQIQ